jgi:hypothetical protein
MGKMAYSIAEAAIAATVTEGVVTEAIRSGSLAARLAGADTIVPRADLKAWLADLPRAVSPDSRG